MYINKKLDCGIKVICEKVENFHSCSVGVWVKAGSVTENEKENGISHLIEHMVFKGTEKRSPKQISIDVDNMGGQINAFTSKECTCYYIKVIDEKIDSAIEVLSDIFINSTFDEKELEKEKGVVIEEIAMYNDTPDEVVHEIVSSAFFTGTVFEKTILGPASNIKSFSRKDIIDYREKYYNTENIVIAVAGNFEEDAIFDSLNKYFCSGKLPTGKRAEISIGDFKPIKRDVSESKDIEQAHICMAFPGFSMVSEKRYELALLNNIFGGSMSSRLFQSIREERGLAYSVYSYPSVYSNTGMFSIYAGTTVSNKDMVTELINGEIDKLIGEKITKQEFEQSKQQLKGSYILALESTSARMNAIGKAQLLAGSVKTDEEMLGIIEKTKYDDTIDIIKDVFCRGKETYGVVGKF